MMDFFNMMDGNGEFFMRASGFGALAGVLILLALVDLGLKGWGMWRAARMGKSYWFIALLIVNSMGILPTIFLLLTNEEYTKGTKKTRKKK